ncbi:MAG: 4-hydroxythreonine-4-phosphate dehydrogenase PdxA [Syntrophorhabdaceae bacterium]|nr:4-hydroxythreonine-4-phosphate dehydrogenase PdxA [Syntrophorhabdaceae bacterium]
MWSGQLPKIAVTMGDPAGIGPEIAVLAHARPELFSWCRPVVYGDPAILRRAMSVTGTSLEIAEDGEPGPGRIVVAAPCGLRPEETPFGQPSLPGYAAMAGYIQSAVRDILSGKASAVVTCPITKEGLKAAGVPFPGHTEFLVHLCGGADVVMMLAGDRLRVALVTIHVSLKEALDLLSPALIEKTIRVTDAFFRKYMGMPAPRIAVAALNPHAGEGGMFGDEESRLIAPALEACRADGIDATGPYPPDTVFYRAYHGAFDVVVAMTHDHGLIPLKLVHFGDAVNVTMGLPVARTSVDHGTAYDIAGKGTASPASLLAAVRMAAGMTVSACEQPKADQL